MREYEYNVIYWVAKSDVVRECCDIITIEDVETEDDMDDYNESKHKSKIEDVFYEKHDNHPVMLMSIKLRNVY